MMQDKLRSETPAPACLKEGKGGVRISVLAVPKARITEIVDLSDNRCKIRVKAPPVKGEANLALIEFLAGVFGLTKRQVSLEHGSRGKQKVFLLNGISLGNAGKILGMILDSPISGKEKK